MAYCGYADFLMVIMFVTVLILLLSLVLIILVLLRDFEIVVISRKLFVTGFYRDLEITVTV